MSRLSHTIYLGVIAILIAVITCLLDDMANGPERNLGTIAVLPFATMNQEESAVRFTDSITAKIEQAFALEPALQLAPRAAVEAALDTRDGIDAIGRALGVENILEGSVRVQGDRIRITAQVIQVKSDDHLWAETWDRDVADVDAIVAEIAKQVIALSVNSNAG